MDETNERAELAAERAQRHHDGALEAQSETGAIVHALFAIEARLEEQAWRLKKIYEDMAYR